MRRFEAADLEEMNRWFHAHGLPPAWAELLPKFGLIEPGVACGFLYETDSAIAVIEGFASNPEAPPEARHVAIDGIAAALTERARVRGFHQCHAYATDDGIARRATAWGNGRVTVTHLLFVRSL